MTIHVANPRVTCAFVYFVLNEFSLVIVWKYMYNKSIFLIIIFFLSLALMIMVTNEKTGNIKTNINKSTARWSKIRLSIVKLSKMQQTVVHSCAMQYGKVLDCTLGY